MTEPDPFLIEPELWFGVLCEQVELDPNKRFTFRNVFTIWFMDEPPAYTELPSFAKVDTILAVGFSHGVGEFTADVELRDVDEKLLWRRPDPWIFRVGPGDGSSAALVEKVEHWFREPGNYYFVVRVHPPGTEHRIRLEIARRPRPVTAESPNPPS